MAAEGKPVDETLELTVDIVAAYVAHNRLAPSALPGLIESIYAAVVQPKAKPVEPEAPPALPAVPIKKSITPDYLICLEDGKQFKSLKRHLATHYDLTPDDYRRKWGLPPDYPMVAPNYAAKRSALAKSSGLGRKAAVIEVEPEPEPEVVKPKRRGPKPKVAVPA